MESSKISSIPIIFFTIFLLLSSLPHTHSTDLNLIDEICKKTPFYDLCVQSLTPENPISDVKAVAFTMANLILSNATDTLTYIQALIKEGGTDPELQRPLANCAELYIPVVRYNLPQAIDALKRGRFGFTSYLLADAGNQAKACENNFSGSNQSPLSFKNKLLSNLCDVAVAILKLLQKG